MHARSISRYFSVIVLASVVLVLGACGPTPTPTPLPTTVPTATNTPAATATVAVTVPPAPTLPPATATAPAIPTTDVNTVPSSCRVVGQPLFINSKDRYCLAFPIQFKPGDSSPGHAALMGPALDTNPDPVRASMTVDIKPVAAGTTLKQAVDAFIKDQPQAKPAITRKSITLGGEPAEVLENVPARLSSRNILAVHQNQLFIMYFQPLGVQKAQSDVEALYKAVSTSFAFLPDLPWAQAVALIQGGLVTKVSQTHSLEIKLTLSDGRTLGTMEPQIDEVLTVIKQCGERCTKIQVATE